MDPDAYRRPRKRLRGRAQLSHGGIDKDAESIHMMLHCQEDDRDYVYL